MFNLRYNLFCGSLRLINCDFNDDYFMELFEFELICWRRHNTNTDYQV